MYYDASYFVAPDGKAGTDVYAVLREAIAKTGKTALARVVISQRERTIALRPMGEGLMAHTLHEDRDLNSPKELFEELAGVKTDPEMVQLATQLIQRQSGKYDAADLEDRYETRLRAMIDAKLKGEGIDADGDAGGRDQQRGRSDGGAEEEPWTGSRRETSQACKKGCEAEARGGSGGHRFPEAGLNGLLFFPAVQPDQPPLLFETDDAVDLGLARQMADLTVAEAAFRAVEADYHRGLLR